MAAKLVFPLVKSGYMAGMGHLHMDQHDIVGGIAVEPGHGTKIIPVVLTFKQLLDPLSGGLIPAVFARSLAAARRCSLYGSRIKTQAFGTV